MRRALCHAIVFGSIAVLLLGLSSRLPATAGGTGAPNSRTGQAGDLMVISSAEEPTVLGAAPVQAMLTAPEGEGKGGQSSLAANLLSLPSGVTAYLVLQGLSADVPPGITYNVYHGLPTEAPTAGPADPHYVGSLSFFDAVGRPQSVAEGRSEERRGGKGVVRTCRSRLSPAY